MEDIQLAQYQLVEHKQYLKKIEKYQRANFLPVIIINNLLLSKDEKVCVLNMAEKKTQTLKKQNEEKKKKLFEKMHMKKGAKF